MSSVFNWERIATRALAKVELLENDCIKAKNMIRDFRDSDEHICPADRDGEHCSCGSLDDIIDVLSD